MATKSRLQGEKLTMLNGFLMAGFFKVMVSFQDPRWITLIVSPNGMAKVRPLFGSHDILAKVVEAKKSFEVGIAFDQDLTSLLVPTSQMRTDPSQLDDTYFI